VFSKKIVPETSTKNPWIQIHIGGNRAYNRIDIEIRIDPGLLNIKIYTPG